jgi:transposase
MLFRQATGRINVIGALLGSSLLTVSLFTGSINAAMFAAWLSQDLLPKLPEKSIIVMDNASFHKSSSVKQLIHDNRHTLIFLPPYSPDLNPIEHKGTQAKVIRKHRLCSIDELFTQSF